MVYVLCRAHRAEVRRVAHLAIVALCLKAVRKMLRQPEGQCRVRRVLYSIRRLA